ncbi:MAG: nuclear transport factor 2 family protein [Mucilaginibacter sp.]
MEDNVTQENLRIVKDLFAAFGRGDKQGLLKLVDEDIEWVTPGEDWPLAGTRHGHAGLLDLVQTSTEELETTFPEPPEFVAQGELVLVIGSSTGKVKATNKPFEDHFVIATTVRNGKVTKVREYVDTQAMSRASEMPVNPKP